MNRNELIGRIWQEFNDARTSTRRNEIMAEMFMRMRDADIWTLAIELGLIRAPQPTVVPEVQS